MLGEYKEKVIYYRKGKYGPYIQYDKKNIRIPKDTTKKIDIEVAKKIIDNYLSTFKK